MRHDGRATSQLRPIRITPNFTKNPNGSVLIETGETRVLCTVNVEDSVPNWMRNVRPPQGWLTAEYSMLPSATHSRTKRERNHIGGRTQEIQRLIGRSLRGVMDFNKCPDMTFMVDCDVLQADGGTRTAAITGAYVALKIAVDKLIRSGKLKKNPLIDGVGAVSVGLIKDEVYVDLDYKEDSNADTDMNVVMTHSGKFLEVQGTAEKASFSKEQVTEILSSAEEALKSSFELQNLAADGQTVES
ncbi:MAG: ribonuclease PH [Oligoflexales bacterium]|nr:ribonuclease PH [Oligoflexales bacterium]